MTEPLNGSFPPEIEQRVVSALSMAVEAVYRDTARPPRDVVPGALLGADLGLDSLDLAQVVVLLERSLGVDPFRDPVPAARGPVRTVDQLVTLYAVALSASGTRPS